MAFNPNRNGKDKSGPGGRSFRAPPLMLDLAYRPAAAEITFAERIVRAAAVPGCRDLAAAILSDRTGHLNLLPFVDKAARGMLGQRAQTAIPAFMSIKLPQPSMWLEFTRHDRQYGILAESLADGRTQLRHATLLASNALGTPIAMTLLDTRGGPPTIDPQPFRADGLSTEDATDEGWIEWLASVMTPVMPPGRTLNERQRDRWQAWAMQDLALLSVALSPAGRFQ